VFPLLKTCWALIGAKASRGTKKDCGKPGCPNDHGSQVLAVRVRLPLMADFVAKVENRTTPKISQKVIFRELNVAAPSRRVLLILIAAVLEIGQKISSPIQRCHDFF
jgi:hypothetical protein